MADLTVQFPSRNGATRVDSSQAAKQRAELLAINDPRPVAHVSAVWRTAAQAATIGIFIILFIAALDLARAMLLPATSAFVIGLMLGSLSARAFDLAAMTQNSASIVDAALRPAFRRVKANSRRLSKSS